MTREVVTICCPECVGAGAVQDWSRLDPRCGLCAGCGRIDLDQPVGHGAATDRASTDAAGMRRRR